MNVDIRLSLGFFDHPKTMKLAKRCGIEAVICLQRLWMWAAEQRPSGILTGMDGEDIELAAKWQGEDGKFVQTLLDLRWVDDNDGQFVLHGWEEHQAYASKSEDRHSSAKKAAEARWEKKRAMQEQCGTDAEPMRSAYDPQCGTDAQQCEAHTNSNAPKHQNTGVLKAPLSSKDDIPPRTPAPSPKTPRAKFVPPTVEEVQAYCDARCNGISAQRFCDYYASQGWKKNNGQPVKDWQACVRQWEERDRNEAQLPAVSQGAPHFSNYGQEVKYQQQQQAQALLAARDIFKQNPEDIPPEWR